MLCHSEAKPKNPCSLDQKVVSLVKEGLNFSSLNWFEINFSGILHFVQNDFREIIL